MDHAERSRLGAEGAALAEEKVEAAKEATALFADTEINIERAITAC
jgi:hypothetical protein